MSGHFCQVSRWGYLARSVVMLGVLAFGSAVQAQECTPKDADDAESAADFASMDTWAKAAEWMKKYRQCDDGGISELYSESVAHLLEDKWETLPQLLTLEKANPGLEKFVLAHINSTLSADDELSLIISHATKECPKNSAALPGLCARISAAAKAAATESEQD